MNEEEEELDRNLKFEGWRGVVKRYENNKAFFWYKQVILTHSVSVCINRYVGS